jgi:hypothetical protein
MDMLDKIKSKKITLLSILLVCIAVTIIVVFLYFRSLNYYKGEINGFIVEPITINRSTYEIKEDLIYSNGHILSSFHPILKLKIYCLAYYSVQVRIDPLFGMDGANPGKINQAVDLLKKSTGELSAIDNFTKEQVNFTKENIHPIKFLYSLAALEDSRQKFIAAPSDDRLDIYNSALKNTINDYGDSIDSIKKVALLIEEENPKYKKSVIYYLYGSSSIAQFVDSFDDLKKNSENKKSQFNNRLACLRGYWVKCESLSSVFSQRASVFLGETKLEDEDESDQLNPDTQKTFDLVTSFLKDNENSYGYREEPIIGLNTSCFGTERKSYFINSWIKNKDIPVYKPRLVNDLFFVDLSPYKNKASFFDPLVARNKPYYWQSETNFYLCPDLNYQAEFFSDFAIIEAMKSGKSFKQDDADFSNLAKEANKIIGSSLLASHDFSYYFSNMADLLFSRGEMKLKDEIGKEKVLFFEKLLNIYYQRSSNLDDLIISGWHQNINFKKFMKSEKNVDLFERDTGYYFLRRSAPSVYFLTFNRSVMETKSRFFKSVFQKPFSKYISIYDIDSYSKEEILDLMQLSFRLYDL